MSAQCKSVLMLKVLSKNMYSPILGRFSVWGQVVCTSVFLYTMCGIIYFG